MTTETEIKEASEMTVPIVVESEIQQTQLNV